MMYSGFEKHGSGLMVAFLSILLAVALLGITVYGLHRYQTMEVEYTVDRSTPLPPLDDAESDADNPGKKSAASDRAAKPRPVKVTQNWLNKVAQLKKSGDFEAALAICEEEFPLWGAYNQACIIERLKIKDDDTPDPIRESGLQRLYQLAVTAELLHDKTDETEHLTLNQLKELDLSTVNDLRHDYSEIGYAHLRLIRKSDIKIMLSLWGRPEQHAPPRAHHRQWWESFISQQT